MAGETILIVEDNGIIAILWEAILAEHGYTVLEIAASGEAAIAAAAERRPDLVLMDVTLAGEMNGFTAAERIRADSDVPIVFLTGYSPPLVHKKAKNAEPYGYVIKPVIEEELTAEIEKELDRHRTERKKG